MSLAKKNARQKYESTRKAARAWGRNPGERYKKERRIYLIRAGGSQWYKVGVAADPSSRVCGIQAGNPYVLHLIEQWGPYHSKAAHALEGTIQRSLVAKFEGARHAPGGKDWIEIDAETDEVVNAIRLIVEAARE